MFGMGFTEILLIAIIALLFIGPDKLPDTMKTIARTFGKIKRALDDTKSTIEQELRVDDLRAEVMEYKSQLEKAKSDLSAFKNVAAQEIDDIKQSSQIENRFEPPKLDDDKELDRLFEEAEAEFEELESKSDKQEFKNGETKKSIDIDKEEDSKLNEFKNIKEGNK